MLSKIIGFITFSQLCCNILVKKTQLSTYLVSLRAASTDSLKRSEVPPPVDRELLLEEEPHFSLSRNCAAIF